ncbi:MAG: PIG-L deacetylase family protein [Patescibacteria group bacterium]
MTFIFVFAHPDDESFSSGGTIAQLAKKGEKVVLVTATKGEKGQLGDPPIASKKNLGKTREKELENAAKILGISSILFLNFIDGTLQDHADSLRKKILEIFIKKSPDVVVTFDRHGGSNHPDHKTISRSTTESFENYMRRSKKHVHLYHTAVPRSYLKKYEKSGLTYIAFGKMKGTPDEDITTVVDIRNTYDLKVKALQMHKTQKKDVERFLKRSSVVDLKKEFFELIYENSIE